MGTAVILSRALVAQFQAGAITSDEFSAAHSAATTNLVTSVNTALAVNCSMAVLGAAIPMFGGIGRSGLGGSSGRQQIFRAVEPDELADIAQNGSYRVIPGLEGKYFFPTQQQAENFASLMTNSGRGPYCVTSGCIPADLLARVDAIELSGEGAAYFIPEELLPYIDDIITHGG